MRRRWTCRARRRGWYSAATLTEPRGLAKRVRLRLGKDTRAITLDGNTVEGFAAKVDDKRK